MPIEYLSKHEDKHGYRPLQVPETKDVPFKAIAPAPSPDAKCKVHMLRQSDLTMPLSMFVRTSDQEAPLTLPVFTFMIEHASGRRVAFDLGLKLTLEAHSPFTQEAIKDVKTTWPRAKLPDMYKEHGIDADSVEAVVLSHTHFDHIGDIGQWPTKTKLIVGPRTLEASLPGYPTKQDSSVLDSDLPVGTERELIELNDKSGWVDIGAYKGIDYFGDGSFYILEAYGHMIGHVAALVRTTTSPDTYVLLAGDSAHVRGLYSCCPGCTRPPFRAGLYPASGGLSPSEKARGGLLAIHFDLPAAYANMGRMARMEEEDGITVVLGHDLEWEKIIDSEQGKGWELTEITDWKKQGRKEQVKKGWVYTSAPDSDDV